MEIKWYWLAEQLGLVQDVSALYDDGTRYVVSSEVGDVFFWLRAALVPLLFLLGFALCVRIASPAPLRVGVGILLTYTVLLAVGVGPYVKFYPQGSGFLDLSTLEHILSGIGCAALALSL